MIIVSDHGHIIYYAIIYLFVPNTISTTVINESQYLTNRSSQSLILSVPLFIYLTLSISLSLSLSLTLSLTLSISLSLNLFRHPSFSFSVFVPFLLLPALSVKSVFGWERDGLSCERGLRELRLHEISIHRCYLPWCLRM